ncbi:hypothetical protein Btru_025032 [Bulinus truncatus]|nr:hypothetical protein Btru_025032 [Bulinus truncatus]
MALITLTSMPDSPKILLRTTSLTTIDIIYLGYVQASTEEYLYRFHIVPRININCTCADKGHFVNYPYYCRSKMAQGGSNLDLSVLGLLTLVNDVGLINLFGLSGIMVNVVNAVVFFRQGLDVSINITFFSISLIDIFSTVFYMWRSFCVNPFNEITGLPLNFNDVKYLTGGWPGACTSRITGWLTVYITVERVLSVVTPLKVKLIMTPKITALNIACICLANVVLMLPEYFSMNIGWKYVPEQNRTLLGLIRTGRIPLISDMEFKIHAWSLIVSFVAMFVFTAILIVKLKRQSRWRELFTAGNFTGTGQIGAKQRRTISMIVAFTSAMIFFYTPHAVCTVMTLGWPDFTVMGKLASLYNACWSIVFLFHIIHANVSIFLFARMSSKYRKTLKSLFHMWVSR